MKRFPAWMAYNDRGLAGLEFAMTVPILLLLLGGVTDFALAFWNKGLLASSVAQGAHYAFLVGPTVTAASIQGIVRKKLSLPAGNVNITGPACFCISGTPATTAPIACTQLCPGAVAPVNYVKISATYSYTPMLPLYSQMAATSTFTEAATVRLK